jgi:hypothetical protein
MAKNKTVLIAVLILGGATALFFLTKKKTAAAPSAASEVPVVNNPATVTTQSDGTITAKAGNIITTQTGTGTVTITDASGNAVDSNALTDQQRQDLVNALNAQNAAVAAIPQSQWKTIPNAVVNGVTTAIPSDLYNTYVANKAAYAAAGKPPPLQFDNTIPGQVTVTPYDDPTHPVTYADPDGNLTFTNDNGTPVPNDPAAVIINSKTPANTAAPIAQTQSAPSSGSGNTGNNTQVMTPPIVVAQPVGQTTETPLDWTAIDAEAAENTALAANPGSAPVNTDSEGNQYVVNNEGEAVYLGVPTFADNLAAVPGMTQDASGVWHWNGL